MNIYQSDGYLNMSAIIENNYTFNFLVGGRGIGKTYGAIKYCIEHGIKFIYMRRTDTIIQTIVNSELSPVKPVMDDMGKQSAVEKINKYVTGFYEAEQNADGTIKPIGDPIGIAVGLSIMGNMRGWSAADYTVLINDEFIPEKHEHTLKNESSVFFNAYETINRNRELQGQPPLKVLFLANANDMTNDYFMELNLINVVDTMQIKNQTMRFDKNRGIAIYLLHDSPISEEKKETALYKLTSGTMYSNMAIDNDFVYEDRGRIDSRPLIEYKALVRVGELVIYKHKTGTHYYVCLHLTGTCPTYGITDVELKRFTYKYIYLWSAYLSENIIFETYTCEALFRKYYK